MVRKTSTEGPWAFEKDEERRWDEWKDYLSKLRQANIRKTKLLEILARLESRRIVEGK